MTKEKRKVTLKVLRAMKGMKQSDIADKLKELGRNIDQGHVSSWERGVTTPTIEVAIDMAAAYDVTFIELVRALGFEPDIHRLQTQGEKHQN